MLLLPHEAIRLLLYQRSNYRQPILRMMRVISKKLGISGYYDNYVDFYVMSRFERFRIKKIAELYNRDLQSILDNIKNYLPRNAGNILDIGSGMAGIDLFIARHYDLSVDIYLLDKEGISEEIVAGFHSNQSKFSYYNSFSLASQFLETNGISVTKIHTVNIDAEPFPVAVGFDLIISLLSWGFHYPVDAYIDNVYRALNNNGVLILDIRKNTDGEKKLEEKFGKKPVCIEHGKEHARYVVVK